MARTKLKFGTKKRYKYASGEHSCHICNKGIKEGLQLHHHNKKKSKGGSVTRPVHDKCHKKTHGNYNHVLTQEDRRKAGLKTYLSNLKNMKNHKLNLKRGQTSGYITNKTTEAANPPRSSQNGPITSGQLESRQSSSRSSRSI